MNQHTDPPRHLPHLQNPRILHMGLNPLDVRHWIEPEDNLPRYHTNKLEMRSQLGDKVYRAQEETSAAQAELSDLLLGHLLADHGDRYTRDGDQLHYLPADLRLPVTDDEILWNSSLWVADDLLLLQEVDGRYRLTAASLACPSDWLLEEKFGQALAQIHSVIPGFDRELTPRVDRFFRHLKPEHAVERFNWSLQCDDALCRRGAQGNATPDTRLYYRTERQTLRRLPATAAVVFTIKVQIDPLDALSGVPGALAALFAAIDQAPPALRHYKGLDTLAPALATYRASL